MGKVGCVFVHSYSSAASNWQDVMIGGEHGSGRLPRALALARYLNAPLLANDAIDPENQKLLQDLGITNLGTAKNTRDEVQSALDWSPEKPVMFVTSPDHLPRVVRDAMTLERTDCLFAASSIPFSQAGADGVKILEPPHDLKPAR